MTHERSSSQLATSNWTWICDSVLLAGFVFLVYFSRVDNIPLRGEESRRALVALEIMRSNDWVVPTQQGDSCFESCRPPLHNWLIALAGRLHGSVDAFAVRLPSVLAMLGTVLLVYGYSRLFLSRIGAVAAALVYGTMGQVLQLCRMGETDSLFALFVSGSLLVWHAGQVRTWKPWCTWGLAYLFVALGTLTKGIQAPVYFVGGVGAFLLVTGRWRQALTRSHAFGIAVFLTVWGTWQAPFFARMGWAGLRHIYFGDVALYLRDSYWVTVVRHLAVYPLEIFFGCLMPWSVLLLLYLRRDFRQALAGAGEHVMFLTCSILAAFPTVWLPPTARTRFFLSLYPVVAPLIGLVIQRCCNADHDSPWRRFWGAFLTAAAIVMVAIGGGILAVSILRPALDAAQPLGFASGMAAAAVGLAAVACWSGNSRTPGRRAVGTVALAAFLGVLSTGVLLNTMARKSNTAAGPAVADLKRRLPKDAHLRSLGTVDHLFAYYYGDPVPRLPWPESPEALPPDVEYFCFTCPLDEPRWPAFPFQQLDVICCDSSVPSQDRLVIVGRIPRASATVAERGRPVGR